MTATPTPLRELPPLPQCWTGSPITVTWAEDGERTTREVYTAEQMRAYAEAALSARQEEGAVGVQYKARAYLTDENFGHDRWVADMYSLGRGTHDAIITVIGELPAEAKHLKPIATPPASGEAGAVNDGFTTDQLVEAVFVSNVSDAVSHAIIRRLVPIATPPAASGGEGDSFNSTAAWCSAFDNDAAEWGAHYLAGRLRLATNIIRRLAAVAPAGMAVTAEMVREAFAHLPFDTKGYERWEWFANFINQALARPDEPCQCCGVTPSGQITGAT